MLCFTGKNKNNNNNNNNNNNKIHTECENSTKKIH